MKIVADLHTHTLYSAHAYSTVNEMVIAAKEKNLKAIAITDHGPEMPDTGHMLHFINSIHIPKVINGVLVLYGVELNVIDLLGNVDLPNRMIKELDWVIVSIHKEHLEKLTFEQATNIWLTIAKNELVDMIGHCEQIIHPFDIDRVIKAFADNNKVVELNANSLNIRADGIENMKKIAIACKKYNCKVSLSSDAHAMYTVGEVSGLFPMLKELDFPKHLIINESFENLKEHLISRNKEITKFIKD